MKVCRRNRQLVEYKNEWNRGMVADRGQGQGQAFPCELPWALKSVAGRQNLISPCHRRSYKLVPGVSCRCVLSLLNKQRTQSVSRNVWNCWVIVTDWASKLRSTSPTMQVWQMMSSNCSFLAISRRGKNDMKYLAPFKKIIFLSRFMHDLISELIWHLWNGTFQHKVRLPVSLGKLIVIPT